MTQNNSFKKVDILLVEDNPGDIRLTQEAFAEFNIFNNLLVAIDGDMAMRLLYKKDEFAGVPTPDLILLDLNLPKKDGRQVLKEIKSDEIFRRIPVVVLSTSESESDIQNSYYNYANCYISKPIDFNKFMTVIRELQNFWISIVTLPSE